MVPGPYRHYFKDHPLIQSGTINVQIRRDPSTVGLPERWTRVDEWYNFRRNPRRAVRVLATLDERTYTGGTMGFDHPVAWCQDYRAADPRYTGPRSLDRVLPRPPVRRSTCSAASSGRPARPPATAARPCSANYEKVTLNDSPGEPMDLAVLPDRPRAAHHAQRRGADARPGDRAEHGRGHARCLPARRGGPAEHRDRRRTSRATSGSTCTTQPPLDTPVDDPSTPGVNEGDAPESTAPPADFAPVQGRAAGCRASSSRATSWTCGHRAADHRGAGRPRHLLPRRRPDRLRRAGQPVPVDR